MADIDRPSSPSLIRCACPPECLVFSGDTCSRIFHAAKMVSRPTPRSPRGADHWPVGHFPGPDANTASGDLSGVPEIRTHKYWNVASSFYQLWSESRMAVRRSAGAVLVRFGASAGAGTWNQRWQWTLRVVSRSRTKSDDEVWRSSRPRIRGSAA